MSKFDFANTVLKILHEEEQSGILYGPDNKPVRSQSPEDQKKQQGNNVSVLDILTPKTEQEDFNNLQQVKMFAEQLYKTGDRRFTKDTLMTYKAIWPYADTLDFIRQTLVNAGIFVNKNVVEQFNDLVDVIIKDPSINNGYTLIKKLTYEKDSQLFTKITSETKADEIIDNKLNFLQRNINNYTDYFNLRLRQASSATDSIAAEPYINKTPEESIKTVLTEFGGYDVNLALNITRYPAENQYTQRADNIQGMVMQTIIDIAKLILVFYREWIQINANNILDLLNYAEPYQTTVSRNNTINVNELMQALGQGAGKLQGSMWQNKKKEIINNILPQGIQSVGRQQVPTNSLQKLIHNDYLNFIKGKSVLVLKPEGYNVMLRDFNNMSLIQTVNDFNGQSGRGQSIYEHFVQLFNSMKKGDVPSKWATGGKMAADIIGGTASELRNMFSGFKGF
jgi:hypothetical protein